MPLTGAKSNILKDIEILDFDMQGTVQDGQNIMLGTIRVPKNLRLLAERLPKSNYGASKKEISSRLENSAPVIIPKIETIDLLA